MTGPAPKTGLTFDGDCVHVVDGDTIDVQLTRVVRVRLLGNWSPETRTTDPDEKTRGLAAKRAMERLALGNRVTVFVPTEGARGMADVLTLGRVLGYVWRKGEDTDVSTQMVDAGHATATKEGTPPE